MSHHGLMGLESLSVDSYPTASDDVTLGEHQCSDGSLSLFNSAKVDPSYKSKRYRDKLRTEIKALEGLLPVDKSTLHRKLDSQTVFRLVIAYFRTKLFLEAALEHVQTELANCDDKEIKSQDTESLRNQGNLLISKDILQALDGFLLVVTADGTILFVSRNITHSLGFNQVDLMHRCIYSIVHPDDHHELKIVLETSLLDTGILLNNQKPCCSRNTSGVEICKSVSFLVRVKCFNGTTTGYLKMQCTGHMRSLPNVVKSSRSSNQVVFALCRPFQTVSTDPLEEAKSAGFWSKHSLDLRFKHLDSKTMDVTGYNIEELEGKSFYSLVHPEDLAVFSTCHQILIHTEEVQTMYFRIEIKNKHWLWLHTRGKVVFKSSKKNSILFTHCPVREEDSTYIQQEAVFRSRYALIDLVKQCEHWDTNLHNYRNSRLKDTHKTKIKGPSGLEFICQGISLSTQSTNMSCPSTWHSKSECHSPVFPTTSLPHRYCAKDNGSSEIISIKKRQKHNVNLKSPSRGLERNHQLSPLSRTAPFPQEYALNSANNYTLGGGGKEVLKPSISDHSNFFPARNDQGHFITPMNRVGVTRESAQTTLCFQGQFTAFQKPYTDYLYQDSCGSLQRAISPCPYSNGFMRLAATSQPVKTPLQSISRSRGHTGIAPTMNNLPKVHLRVAPHRVNNSHPRTFKLTKSHLPNYRPSATIDPPQEIIGDPPTIPSSWEIIQNDYGSKHENGVHDIKTMVCDVRTDGDNFAGSRVKGVGGGGTCRARFNDTIAGTMETKPPLPSCLYEGKVLVSSEARCFQPTCPSEAMARVKQDTGENRNRKLGVTDLPNIGSFLEYLKDISV